MGTQPDLHSHDVIDASVLSLLDHSTGKQAHDEIWSPKIIYDWWGSWRNIVCLQCLYWKFLASFFYVLCWYVQQIW